MKNTITKLEYNWSVEGFDKAEIGIKGVTHIVEHEAKGEVDKWFYDIIYEDGRTERIFNPNIVFSSPIN